jgi:hypothetical protein
MFWDMVSTKSWNQTPPPPPPDAVLARRPGRPSRPSVVAAARPVRLSVASRWFGVALCALPCFLHHQMPLLKPTPNRMSAQGSDRSSEPSWLKAQVCCL